MLPYGDNFIVLYLWEIDWLSMIISTNQVYCEELSHLPYVLTMPLFLLNNFSASVVERATELIQAFCQ